MRNGNIPGSDYDKLETAAGNAARTFKERCKEIFAGGSDPYVHYRLMSWYVHPSVAVIDSYLETTDKGDEPAIRSDPKTIDPAPYAS